MYSALFCGLKPGGDADSKPAARPLILLSFGATCRASRSCEACRRPVPDRSQTFRREQSEPTRLCQTFQGSRHSRGVAPERVCS